MLRMRVSAALTVIAALAVVPAAAAQTQPFSASFKNVQTKNSATCAGGAVFCGTGAVKGYGPASYSAAVTSLGPLSGSCQSVTAVVSIRLESGAGSLSLSADGNVCYPGNSHNTPGSLHSFGNPLRVRATYAVRSGTGAFAGASGTGTALLKAAGAHSALAAHGTLGL